MIWHVCCGMFWHVCFCQVVYWHVLANVCVLFTWTLLTGAILSSRQDTTRSCKSPEKKDAGLAGFEMQENDVCHILLCWDLFGLFQRTFSTSLDLFLLPVHGIKLGDNPHLTTPTQHVMVGITRSKVIFLVQCCAHHHDSGSLCSLCLRSGKDPRVTSLVSSRRKQTRKSTKQPPPNTTQPNQTYRTT